MIIEQNQIKSTKKVGTLKGADVFMLVTKGGLHLVASPQKGSIKYLGTGPNVCVSKFVTEKNEPDVLWEISKSEDYIVDVNVFAPIIPDYIELTKKFNES
jgi:hypothetical protein